MPFVSSNRLDFKLTSRRMIQTGQFFKRYSAKRRDIRLMFLHLHHLNNESSVAVRYYIGRKPNRVSAQIESGYLHIGCQTFKPYQTQQLRSWAFEKPPASKANQA